MFQIISNRYTTKLKIKETFPSINQLRGSVQAPISHTNTFFQQKNQRLPEEEERKKMKRERDQRNRYNILQIILTVMMYG